MSARFGRTLAAATALVLLSGGCSTLGGNVQGSFACRAPEGTCAPTSLIDEQATGISGPAGAAAPAARGIPGPGARTLQIVVAAYRDAAGRDHEARVVHVALPDAPGNDWRLPLGRSDVLRALGSSLAIPREADAQAQALPTPSTAHLPDQLFIPSQPGPALPGANAPDAGAPDRPASPDRVPHLAEFPETLIPGDER